MTGRHFSITLAVAAVCATTSVVAADDEVHLHNGDVLRGTVLERTETGIRFQHPGLGELSIGNDRMKSLVTEQSRRRTEVYTGLLQEQKEKEWNGHVNIGGSGSFGNTDNQGFHAAVTLVRERPDTRLTLDAAYFWAATDGDNTENRFTAGALHDWFLGESPWSIFAQARFDYDDFQSWDKRLAIHGGVGYQFIDEEDVSLILRGGLGATREWGSEDDRWIPEALVGFDWNWDITDKQNLFVRSTAYLDLEDTGEFRTLTDAGWSVLLDEEANMNFNIGLHHEYDSTVDPGMDHNDLRIFAGLQVDF